MKKSFFFIVFIVTFSIAEAQPCKKVKGGMTKSQVLKLVGPPESIDLAGFGNGNDTLLYWNYGNQQVIFSEGKVESVKSDLKKEAELAKKLASGEIQPEEYFDLLDKIAKEGCK